MANSEQQPTKQNIAERGLRFFRNFHIGLGALALGGAVLFPGSALLPTFAAYEGAHALVDEGARQIVEKKPKASKH